MGVFMQSVGAMVVADVFLFQVHGCVLFADTNHHQLSKLSNNSIPFCQEPARRACTACDVAPPSGQLHLRPLHSPKVPRVCHSHSRNTIHQDFPYLRNKGKISEAQQPNTSNFIEGLLTRIFKTVIIYEMFIGPSRVLNLKDT